MEAAGRVLASGEAAEFAEALMRELGGEAVWRRERVLERLGKVPGAGLLVPHFAAALGDPRNPERRNAARSALAALGSPTSVNCAAATTALGELMLHSHDVDTRLLAAAALGEAGNARARADLETALGDPDANVAAAAAEALGLLGDTRAVPALLDVAERGDFWVRATALLALGRLRDPRGLPALATATSDPLLAPAAAEAAGQIGDPAGLELLRGMLTSDEGRSSALAAVARIYGANPELEVPDWLRTATAVDEAELRRRFAEESDPAAARLLGIAGTREAAIALVDGIGRDDLRAMASVGLASLPRDLRVEVILRRLEQVSPPATTLLLESLPRLSEPEEIEAVVRHLGDADAEVRAAAAEVLGRSDADLVLPALLRALEQPELRLGTVLAFGRLGRERCGPLLRLVADDSVEVRIAAVSGLARCGAGEVPVLASRIEAEQDDRVREALVAALGEIGGDEVVPILAGVLDRSSTALRFAAARALGRTHSGRALNPLLKALRDEAPEVRIAALSALGELGDPRAFAVVGDHLDEGSRELRRTAVRAFARMADPTTAAPLLRSLEDPDREVRLTAIETLGRIGGAEAEAALATRVDVEPDPIVRNAASRTVLDLRERGANAT